MSLRALLSTKHASSFLENGYGGLLATPRLFLAYYMLISWFLPPAKSFLRNDTYAGSTWHKCYWDVKMVHFPVDILHQLVR